MSRTILLLWLWLLLHVLLLFCSSFWYGCRLWLKCVRLPTLLVMVVIVVCAAIVSFGCWLGLFLPEPGDILSANESNELSILSVSFLWWIIGSPCHLYVNFGRIRKFSSVLWFSIFFSVFRDDWSKYLLIIAPIICVRVLFLTNNYYVYITIDFRRSFKAAHAINSQFHYGLFVRHTENVFA